MDEDLILQQPIDRRLDNENIKNLPPGPPGVEIDASEYEQSTPIKMSEKSVSSKYNRRRLSSSKSPSPRKRLSTSRSRQSSNGSRRCRSPYPRRNRFRESSPERRRYGGGDNWYRSNQRARDRSRGRSRNRSRDRNRSHERERDRRSVSPRNRNQYRDERKSSSYSPRQNKGLIQTQSAVIVPPLQQQLPLQPLPQVSDESATNAQYVIVPAALYGESFGPPAMYNQYNLPPPGRPAYVAPGEGYNMQTSTVQQFNTNYPQQNTWSGTDTYAPQPWMQHAVTESTMQAVPATAPAPIIATSANIHVPEVASIATVAQQVKNATPNDAVAMEAENHRGELKKQRIGYQRKMRMLVNELNGLRQKQQNIPSNSGDQMADNGKLQKQIERKIGAIENVIDMLTNIIGDRAEFEQKHGRERIGYSNNFNTSVTISKHESHKDILERFKKALRATISQSDGEEKSDGDDNEDVDSDSSVSSSSSGSSSSSTSTNSSIFNTKTNNRNKKAVKLNADLGPNDEGDEEDDSSSERLKSKAIESMRSKKAAVAAAAARARERARDVEKPRFNFTFYDPETHWCRTCNAFPKTARDYLNHLHTTEHIQREMIETPWHEIMPQDDFPEYENVPTKRVPIRGIMFFSPASSWFCKLCKIWIGDLHCASVHLKSQTHYYKYNEYITENPDFEINWETDRLRKHGEILTASRNFAQPVENDNTISSSKVVTAPSPDIGYVRSLDMRSGSYKNIDNRNKNESSSDSSDDSDDYSHPKSTSAKVVKTEKPFIATNLKHAAVRKQPQTESEQDQEADSTVAPPPPPRISVGRLQPLTSGDVQSSSEESDNGNMHSNLKYQAKLVSKRNSSKEEPRKKISEKNVLAEPKYKISKSEIVEPSTSRKRELSKSDNEEQSVNETQDSRREKRRGSSERRRRLRSRSRSRDRRRSRSRSRSRDRRRTRSRSLSRGRYRGRGRSRSRGRRSPSRGRAGAWNRRRAVYRRSRSRSLRRRSRTSARRRRVSRSRSRSRSRSNTYSRSPSPTPRRIEKAIVKHSEFRPRVPPPESSKKKTSSNESKEKNDAAKKASASANNSAASTNGGANGKKLPFIGKMPVFKKHTNSNGSQEVVPGQEKDADGNQQNMNYPSAALMRPQPPTAAQIQMAMMEDAYGNAPPFHPDAGVGMVMDYDDLMPDPVEFVNLMGPVPPPPPTAAENSEGESDSDMLPPGIDQIETDEFVITTKPPNECETEDKSNLPKDFEEALNIIFPGQKKPEDEEIKKKQPGSTETQIIVDEPVMQVADLVKEGIHLVTSDDINIIAMDDASQMSMNEPLIFHQRNTKPRTSITITEVVKEKEVNTDNSVITATLKEISPQKSEVKLESADKKIVATITTPDDIPMPEEQTESISTEAQEESISTTTMAYNLEDIPRPPPSPTESEKNRRQEALDDLAMLGIDADDMAAQCM